MSLILCGGEGDPEEVGKAPRAATPWASAAGGAQVHHLAAMFTFLLAIRMLPNTELVQPEGFCGPPAPQLRHYLLSNQRHGLFQTRGERTPSSSLFLTCPVSILEIYFFFSAAIVT